MTGNHCDRRDQIRYRIKNGVYAAYGPTFLRMGPLVDVSLKGFSYCYKSQPLPDNNGQEERLDLCLRVNDFYLDRIPYEIVYKVESDHQGLVGKGLPMVRYGVRFLDLTPFQENILKQLMHITTCELVPDRRRSLNRRSGRNRRKYDDPQFQSDWRQGMDRRKRQERRVWGTEGVP
jgi:hypothetical protein